MAAQEEILHVTYKQLVQLMIRVVGSAVLLILTSLGTVYWYEHTRIDNLERTVTIVIPKETQLAIAGLKEDIASLKATNIGISAQLDRALNRLDLVVSRP